MNRGLITAFLGVALMAVAFVPSAQAHKPKPYHSYHYAPAPYPPPKTVVHHYYPHTGYRCAPPPRRVDVYHYYGSCYPSCGYYPAPRRPYVSGYIGEPGWSLIFQTGGRW